MPSVDKDKSVGLVVLPYIQSLERVFKKHYIAVSMRPDQTLRNVLVHPKDKLDKFETCNCVYQIKCSNCDSSYIGEMGRKFKTRLGEHKKDVDSIAKKAFTRSERKLSQTEFHKSAMTDHVAINNHVIDWEQPQILDRESDQRTKQIREAIQIRLHWDVMNRDQGD